MRIRWRSMIVIQVVWFTLLLVARLGLANDEDMLQQKEAPHHSDPSVQDTTQAHVASHGGVVESLGDRHVELVLNKLNDQGQATVEVYVLDAKGQTLSVEGMSAIAHVWSSDKKTSLTLPLEIVRGKSAGAPSHFEAPYSLPEEVEGRLTVVVGLTIDGQFDNIRYSVPASPHAEDKSDHEKNQEHGQAPAHHH